MIFRPALRPSSVCIFCLRSSNTSRIASRTFSAAAKLRDELPNHYETLGLHPSATHAEIKARFYALSKKHHPDRNPADPHASKKFVKISEAYHALGSETKRHAYDRAFARAHHGSPPATPRGSHSTHSASGPAGSRPASGLSRRRGTFRGPPPSFYAQGAYGAHTAKRAGAASAGSHAAPGFGPGSATGAAGADAGADAGAGAGIGTGGFSAGQHYPGFDHDPSLPYWDKAGHARTHAGLGSRRAEARRRDEARWAEAEALEASGSILVNFLMVGGIVVLIGMVPMMLLARNSATERKTEKRDDG